MAKGNTTNHPPHAGQFQKGQDTRRNATGQRNKAAVSFSRSLRDYIVREGKVVLKYTDDNGKVHKATKIETVVRAVYKEAMQGNLTAVNFIAERVEGKITDKVEVTGANGTELFNHNVITALFETRPSGDNQE